MVSLAAAKDASVDFIGAVRHFYNENSSKERHQSFRFLLPTLFWQEFD